MRSSDERAPETVHVCLHTGKLSRDGVGAAVQQEMVLGLHSGKGLPEVGPKSRLS